MDCQQEQVDFGAYYQAPVFYLLRNACAPGLATIIVEYFKNTEYIKKYLEDRSHPENPDARQFNQPHLSHTSANQQQQIIDIESITIFEFLKKIHNRGKKEEDKRRKASKDVEDQEAHTPSRTLHINNLKENEEMLADYKASDLLCEVKFQNLIDVFSKFDVTFLLNLITNDILRYQISPELLEAISVVKKIRNCMYHSGRMVKCDDFQDKFQQLYSALEVIYICIGRETSELYKKKQEAQSQLEMNSRVYDSQIFEELRKEIALEEKAKLSDRCPQSFIMPTVMDTSEEMAVIENLEGFLGHDKLPVLLCGPPGSGKSTILQKLTQKFYLETSSLHYQMVIYLDSKDRITNQCDFREAVSKKISNCCPKTLGEYGIDRIVQVIERLADNILFLVNWNISSLEDKRGNLLGGKWVVCSQVLHHESSKLCHVVRVLPLSDTLVKQMLLKLIPDPEQYQQVVSLYDECKYKGVINSPDMVAIFSEIRTKTPCNQLLQSYLDKKLSNALDAENECRAFGKIAFDSILRNKKEYSDTVLCDISNELKTMLLIPRKNNFFTFRYRVIEDLLAAKYVVSEPNKACKEWVKQVPLFKSVFRFVCAKWCENKEVLKKNLLFLEPYLAKYFDVKSYGNREVTKVKSPGKRHTMADDILNIDSFAKKDSFTKWPFLISIVEYCKFQSDMLELLCELLSHKSVWVFKCKFLDLEKISILSKVLEKVKLRSPTVIKIESGSVVVTLNKIWQMLSELPGLYGYATVEITIMHREIIPVTFESNLPMLPRNIANVHEELYVTKYKGPFMCTTTHFLKCICMRKLEVLDVCVYDVATLAEVLSCEGLDNLKVVVIKVDLRLSEKAYVNFPKLRLPSLPNKATLTLTIRYFDGLQNLLKQVENPLQLKSFHIHGMRIKKNFKLDFSAFESLESLFIQFNTHAAQRSESEQQMEIEQEACCTNRKYEKLMETDQGACCTDRKYEQPMETDQLCRAAQDLPCCHWAFELSMKLSLPKALERLLLRNTGFCNESNIHLMILLWKNNDIQRLTLLDSNLSVKGVRNILLKSHFVASDTLEQEMKKHCIVSRNGLTNVKECLTKKPRLDRKERERRRRFKPPGKELIITSQLNLCGKCKQFPCSCQRVDGEDHRDSLEDVVYLIDDAYQYDILSLSYYSEIITVRKDMCGDLRVHCPLTSVDDDTMANLDINGGGVDEWLQSFFLSLTLAQCIHLDHMKVTHSGAQTVITQIKRLKKQYCNLPQVEPFSLEISSYYHPSSVDEVKNSAFIHFLINEASLVQFKFCCCCKTRCHYVKKARDGKIYLNDECLNV